MSNLGGLLSSLVCLRLTSLASSPPKKPWLTREKIFTFRNNIIVFLWHQKTIISAMKTQEIPMVLELNYKYPVTLREFCLHGLVVNLDGGIDVRPHISDGVIATIVNFSHQVSERYVFRSQVVIDKHLAAVLHKQKGFKKSTVH